LKEEKKEESIPIVPIMNHLGTMYATKRRRRNSKW